MSATQTMDTFKAIEARRSVKHYDPEHKMSEEEVKKKLLKLPFFHQLLSISKTGDSLMLQIKLLEKRFAMLHGSKLK